MTERRHSTDNKTSLAEPRPRILARGERSSAGTAIVVIGEGDDERVETIRLEQKKET